jgi:hypothetical protein
MNIISIEVKTFNCDPARRWSLGRSESADKDVVRGGVCAQKTPLSLARRFSRQSRRFYRDVQRPPRLVPLFPVGDYTPHSICGHHGPIERGSLFCCMICHRSGHDDHPALQGLTSALLSCSDRRCDCPSNTRSDGKCVFETRRQRRQRLFGEFRNLAKKRNSLVLAKIEPTKKLGSSAEFVG